MSRCDCCDRKLSSSELVQKHAHTGEYLNTCNKCLDGLGIPLEGSEDALDYADVEIDEIYNEDCISYDSDVEEE